MSALNLSNAVYELYRLQSDRDFMRFEDDRSQALRTICIANNKVMNMKTKFRILKNEYDKLFSTVSIKAKFREDDEYSKSYQNCPEGYTNTLQSNYKSQQPKKIIPKDRDLSIIKIHPLQTKTKNSEKIEMGIKLHTDNDQHPATSYDNIAKAKEKRPHPHNTLELKSKRKYLTTTLEERKENISNWNPVMNKIIDLSNIDRFEDRFCSEIFHEHDFIEDNKTVTKKMKPLNIIKSSNKCIEVVRNKSERAALPGYTCKECNKFYDTMIEQGIISPNSKKSFLQDCSRHKAAFTPPTDTPESFWELSLKTPKDWNK